MKAPSVFESFNARSLRPSQVAETFVPPDYFFQLTKRQHTVVVGPRGSGKTTLLKMLQLPALLAWKHPSASEVLQGMDYSAVFVPADEAWRVQSEALLTRLPEPLVQAASSTLFTTHALRSLAVAMQHRIEREPTAWSETGHTIFLTPEREAELALNLAGRWGLTLRLGSLIAVKQSLTDRLQDIYSTLRLLALRSSPAISDAFAPPMYFGLEPLAAMVQGIETFNDLVDQSDRRWAFCFDELEIAPAWVRNRLHAALRSADERVIFKLAMSPYSEELPDDATSVGPSYSEDHHTIPLWFKERREARQFCLDLTRSMMRERGLGDRDPREIFGSSYFEADTEVEGMTLPALRNGGRIQRGFASLASKDPSFATYLTRRGIQLDRLDSVEASAQLPEIRKIGPLVMVRDFFRRSNQHGDAEAKLRSRKARMLLYSGMEALFALSEGNPRWLIGLLDRLLTGSQVQTVSPRKQATEIDLAVRRFVAKLATMPATDRRAPDRDNVGALAGRIGRYFFEQSVQRPFSPEPPLTFRIDDSVPIATQVLIGQGLNAGAFIHVDGGPPTRLFRSLDGLKLRLSYVLAASYGMPVRLGRDVRLSTILASDKGREDLLLFEQ